VKQPRLPCFVLPSAADDLNIEVSYLLETAGETVALRFSHAVEQSLNLIADFPQMGTLCSAFALPASSLRWKPLTNRFSRWLVFYRVTPDRIEIVRILGGERDLQSLLK
jgi:plasmid stabilization system protein ParE